MTEHLTTFLNYLEVEKGFSALTIKNYASHLRDFLLFAEVKKTPIDSLLISAYRQYLSGRSLTKGTQNAYLVALRSFVKYLNKRKVTDIDLDDLSLLKLSDRQFKLLTMVQLKQLFNAPRMRKLQGIRDRAILELLFATGLRVSELCSLDRSTINLSTGEFNVVGKGGKMRLVFLSLRAKQWLKKYLFKRTDKYPPLFISIKQSKHSKDMRLTPRQIQKLVGKYAQKAGIKLTPHKLRHQYACDLLSAGADLRSIQEMLGHKNLATTQVYTHVTNPQLKETYLKFHGRGL